MSCSVAGCTNHRRFKPDGISFHTFPRCGELLRLWLNVLGKDIEKWTWSRNKVICSLHFIHDDFVFKGGKNVLKVSAVPSIVSGFNTLKNMPSVSSEGCSNLSGEISDEPEVDEQKLGNFLQYEGTSIEVSEMYTPTSSLDHCQPNAVKTEPGELTAFPEDENPTTPTDSGGKRARIAFVKAIHNYSMSPQTMKIKYEQMRARQAQYRKKLYLAKKTIASLQKELTSLKKAVQELSEQRFLSEFTKEHVEKTFESVPPVLMIRFLKNVESEVAMQETPPS